VAAARRHDLPIFKISRTSFQITKEERSMSDTSTLIGYGGRTIGREELALVPTPAATETPQPLLAERVIIIVTDFCSEVANFIFGGRNSGQ
jgi:hypothetical protein